MIVAVLNTSGSTITRGQVLRQTGISRPRQIPTVDLASAAASSTANIFGVANEDFANNAVGRVVISGSFEPINTASFTVGDPVYLSDTPGSISTTSGTVLVYVGKVDVSSATEGCIFVGSYRSSNNETPCEESAGPATNVVVTNPIQLDDILPAGATRVTEYGSVTLVPYNTETTVVSYTVPVGQTFYITNIVGTGDAPQGARYTCYVNLTQFAGARSSLAEPTITIKAPYGERTATAGQTILVRVTHYYSAGTGDFEATIFGYTL